MTNSRTANRILVVLILLLCMRTVAAAQQSTQAGSKESKTPDAQRDPKSARKIAEAELAEATRLFFQIEELGKQGKNAEILPLAQRMLELREKNLPPDSRFIGQALNIIAATRQKMGDIEGIEPIYHRALRIYENAGDSASVAVIKKNLQALADMKPYPSPKDAKLPLNESKEIQELLDKLDKLHVEGKNDKVIELAQGALAVKEKTLPPGHLVIAVLLNSQALGYYGKGDYAKAEPLLARSLAITEKAVGTENQNFSRQLLNAGVLYKSKGDYQRADILFQRSLAITEKVLGPEHLDAALLLSFLGELHLTLQDYAKAETYLLRSLAIYEKTKKTRPGDMAGVMFHLASAYAGMGDYARAEPQYLNAKRRYSKDRLEPFQLWVEMAALHQLKGEYAEAEKQYTRLLKKLEGWKLGKQHPVLGTLFCQTASFYEAVGNIASSLQLLTRGNENIEQTIALVLATGSEEQKRLFMTTVTPITEQTVSFHLNSASSNAEAGSLALTTLLRRKGRALDAIVDSIEALRRRLNPEDRQLLEQLSATRAQLAAMTLNAPKSDTAEPEAGQENAEEARKRQARQAEIVRIEAEAHRLEAIISERSAEFRVQSQPVTLAHVQEAIPTAAALVEIALYRPYNPKAKAVSERFGAPRYAAYVLRREGPPQWVEIGEAASVDKQIAELRSALADPRRQDVKQLARALDEVVMRPVRKLLGEARQIFVSPDGALNLIPFGALVGEDGRYLVQDYTITYLTSGRDLLRLQITSQSKQVPVIIANPRFDLDADASAPASPQSISGQSAERKSEQRGDGGPEQSGQDGAARRSVDFAQVVFQPLPGTAGEAEALGKIVPGVKVLTEASATEAALKQLSAPAILHIATHGFFLPDQSFIGTRGLTIAGTQSSPALRLENPLLRSGLALSGANQRRSERGEDGILTALEAAGLDLWGTKLVVLSACETGVGEVRNGEGVYGLRRALVLAGSESQVISLWQVSDEATRELMVEYYKSLQAGKGRTEALRQVQLSMIKSGAGSSENEQRGLRLEQKEALQKEDLIEDFSHPFYWASFIQSGDWRSMSSPARAGQ